MKNKLFRFKLLFCLGLIITSSVTPMTVLAIDKSFYSSNDILFYNPDAVECESGAVTSVAVSGGASTLEKSANLETIFSALIKGGMNAIQAAAVMGNVYWESKFNSDSHEGGNDIGYGLVQWSFGRRTGLEAFAKTRGVANSDIPMQMEFLLKEYNDPYYKGRLSETAFENATDVSEATRAWMMKFEGPAMKPPNDPAHLNSQRIPAALKVYELYKDLSPSNGAATTSNCSSDNGAVSGNIVKTALGLAWPTPIANGKKNKSDALPSYQVAREQYNPGGEWSDCGRFVSTVMRASGIDVNYPPSGVSSGDQERYVRSLPEKYQIIENPAGANELQPGDILLTHSHTAIYTGESPYPMVDASLSQRVPSVREAGSLAWMINNGAIAVRLIK